MIFSKSKTILSYRSHQNVKILSMGLIIYLLNSCGTQQEEWKTSESSPKHTPKLVLKHFQALLRLQETMPLLLFPS